MKPCGCKNVSCCFQCINCIGGHSEWCSTAKENTVTLKLHGKMQSGKNRVLITRTGHRYPPARFVEWRANMTRQIVAQLAVVHTYTKPVKATIRYWPGDLIKRDAPGIIDAIWHVLERARILKDDALISDITYSQMPLDRHNPRCEITLEELMT